MAPLTSQFGKRYEAHNDIIGCNCLAAACRLRCLKRINPQNTSGMGYKKSAANMAIIRGIIWAEIWRSEDDRWLEVLHVRTIDDIRLVRLRTVGAQDCRTFASNVYGPALRLRIRAESDDAAANRSMINAMNT